jgi:subtilisin family serine protease
MPARPLAGMASRVAVTNARGWQNMKFSVLARSLTVASMIGIAALSASALATPEKAPAAAQASNRYFVYFTEPGVYHYQGDIDGFARTANVQSNTKFDAGRAEVVSYRAFLAQKQEAQIASLQATLGRELEISYRYDILFSGIAVDNLTAAEAALLAQQPDVSKVEPVRDYELATDRGPAFIGADTLWDGTNTPDGNEYRGEGIVIGVFDTGVNTTHPSFANDAACGFDAGNPKLVAAKDCLGSATCAGANPVDGNGHGSHTASTSGGNTHIATGGALAGFEVSGVAPCAQLITYKVCATNSCDGAAIAAAIATSIVDQVDVVNFSISGGQSPWSDNDRGFLDMVDAGIFVAASAGNTSAGVPNPIGQVNHRGPWVMTVANSTHDRINKNAIDVAGGPQDVYGLKSDAAMPSDVSAQIADAADLGNPLGCTAGGGFAAGSMTGRIGLVRRGDCTFEEKINNAVGAGAIAVLVANNNGGPPIPMGLGTATTRPSLMIGQADGTAISTFLDTNPTAVATIESTTEVSLDPIAGDVLNAGSLRGPIAGGIEVTKPDITGPGTNIFAAVNGGPTSYNFLSGTSMSSPHIAGGAALVKGLNPTWTVQEVKSAIQMTASKEGLKDFTNGTPNNGPWDADDVGNGRIDLTKAALAGLVMNETKATFLAANANQANQRALNIPSMRHMTCTPNCTFTRTVRNTSDAASSWTAAGNSTNPDLLVSVTPATFSFTGGLAETQELTITVTPIADLTAAVAFGEVVLSEATDQSPELHMTVAIRGVGEPPVGDDFIFCSGFEEGEDGTCGGDPVDPDIVVIDDINFVPNPDFTGGAIQWIDGTTCQCDTAPFNFNIYGTPAVLQFFWPLNTNPNEGGVTLDGTTYAKLASGATINASSQFLVTTAAVATTPWTTAGTGYLGFKFDNGGTVNYGYAEITTGAAGRPFTILSVTYNSAGDPITIP